METIATLLHKEKQMVSNRNLGWGATLSAYADEIAKLPRGVEIVSVELPNDLPYLALGDRPLLEVDHHGIRTGTKSSLRQVFEILNLPEQQWTRHFQLVEANDLGHVAAMKAMGATVAEMTEIRQADRKAQGITQQQEAQGLEALQNARVISETVVAFLPHNKSATVADQLALDSQFAHLPKPLLVNSRTELNYFGPVAIVEQLNMEIPGGWSGGNPPATKFWGIAADAQRIEQAYQKALAVMARYNIQ